MKKSLCSFLLLIGFLSAYAQNWQCLQSGVKHYFTNGNGYLRGIRIDSVKTYADSTVFYPYKTIRGNYRVGIPDTSSGSWVGEKVKLLTDGTYITGNEWNDSTIIKTHANPGATWVFYQDTSSLYYKATILSADTMTVSGGLDSLKIIIINAYNSSGVVASDPVNNSEIIISKNHGFVQVFDLFTFPYHPVGGSSYITGTDYYYEECGSQFFRLINFDDPALPDVYNFAPGDVYEFHFLNTNGFGSAIYDEYVVDSILSKTITGGTNVSYYINSQTWIRNWLYSTSQTISSSSGTFNVLSTLLIDSTMMPEETGENTLYYYFPADSSYCLIGNKYSTVSGILFNNFEPCGVGKDYIIGLGNTAIDSCITPPAASLSYSLVYYYKNGIPCGTFTAIPNAVNIIQNKPYFITIFPNPATDNLTIKTTISMPYSIALQNLLGQTLKTIRTTNEIEKVDISDLSTGVYLISITDDAGDRYNEKVVITH